MINDKNYYVPIGDITTLQEDEANGQSTGVKWYHRSVRLSIVLLISGLQLLLWLLTFLHFTSSNLGSKNWQAYDPVKTQQLQGYCE